MKIKNPTFGQQMEFRIPHIVIINAALFAVCTVEIQSPGWGQMYAAPSANHLLVTAATDLEHCPLLTQTTIHITGTKNNNSNFLEMPKNAKLGNQQKIF